MLIKFENKSNRVKGLAFHPQRPWVLASLHNGTIQLWDYRMATLIDKFEEHDGPVRGIDFHRTQPLFVSGGDDYKIKVWNYQLKRCLFNLLGHLDYIRTVQFHQQYPWILSASDDQTLRIWNWQSRQCLSVLTGHNHYVMCAQFHPKEDLALSASLDQTVRVWDIAGLRKKTVSITSSFDNNSGQNGAANDIFGGSDVMVKHVLEGHTRGVNWASFHPKLPLIVSGADDREVKLWRMNERRAWEVDTMRGHINNVSCVLFHPRKELIISNSEDRSIRVWDMEKRVGPHVYRRDTDRYWILGSHHKLNLLAAGHDSGLMIFKLQRERPPFHVSKKEVFYLKDGSIRSYDLKTGRDSSIVSSRRRSTGLGDIDKTLMYNSSNRSQHCVLMTLEEAGTSYYELYIVPKDESTHMSYRGTGQAAVFVSRNRFAVLDKSRQIWLRDLKNETKRKINVSMYVQHIFPGGVGRILMRTAEGMTLYDVQVLKVIASFSVVSRHPVKYVKWAPGHKYCAMFSKANIYITDDKLNELCSINEHSRIKSGAWDPLGVFVYTTATHIKYVLPGGDSGIIRTLDTPIYITSVTSTQLFYIDREVNPGVMSIDTTEYQFKTALLKRKYKDVVRIMKSNKLVGQSIIAYLKRKGFPEVALHFVQDTPTKFNLALECGNIRVALDCAQELKDSECWHKLGVEALRQGNHQVVEAAYQKTKNFHRLSFLYLITGNVFKLSKMLQIATIREDVMGRFHNALYMGNVEERVTVLRSNGQQALAYLTARVHGLDELAEEVAAELDGEVPELPDLSGARLLFPPTPILTEANWPLLEVKKDYFDGPPGEDDEGLLVSDEEEEEEEAKVEDPLAGGWGADMDLGLGVEEDKPKPDADAGLDQGDWGGADLGDLGIDLGDLGDLPGADGLDTAPADGDAFVMPLNGKSPSQVWQESSTLAADLAAAGNFDMAMHVLNRQIGVCDFSPLKETFLALYNSTRVFLPQLPGSSSTVSVLQRKGDLPRVGVSLDACAAEMKVALKAVTDGRVEAALNNFQHILHMIPLVVVEKKAQETEVRELVKVCREYVTAVRLELARRQSKDLARQTLLAAYFTHCQIKPLHLVIGLKVAIKCAFSLKNFKMAAGFCRRILELTVSSGNANLSKLANPAQIRGVLKHCEKANTDAVELDFPEGTHFDIDCASFCSVSRSDESSKCPYCMSMYKAESDGQVCRTCQLSRIGADVVGLKCYASKE